MHNDKRASADKEARVGRGKEREKNRNVSVPSPVLPQQHVKDPGHSAKSAVAGYS